jgi:hypothetical protein
METERKLQCSQLLTAELCLQPVNGLTFCLFKTHLILLHLPHIYIQCVLFLCIFLCIWNFFHAIYMPLMLIRLNVITL